MEKDGNEAKPSLLSLKQKNILMKPLSIPQNKMKNNLYLASLIIETMKFKIFYQNQGEIQIQTSVHSILYSFK